MTVGFNFSIGFGKGKTQADFDPSKFDAILDDNGKVIGYKPKKDKIDEKNYLKDENKGDTVQFSTAQTQKAEEQAKVEKTCKNVQNEFNKVTNKIDVDVIAKEDQHVIAEAENSLNKLENNPFITSFKAGLMAQNILKNIDDMQQNANNSVTIESDIKKEAKEKDTTVTGIKHDFGFLLASAYKTFGETEVEEEKDMDLVG